MAYFIRADMADIRVWLDGAPMGGMWATYEGGALEADDQKTRPGGMQRQIAIGGPTSRNDVTITTQFTDAMAAIAQNFENRSGRGSLQVIVTYLDMDGNTTAFRFTRTGIVKSVQIPDVDVNSGDVAFLTVIGSMHEEAKGPGQGN
jgi:hypothetical protein